jgi:peptidoglycan hydrolase-like protein with peptidoglycan-binding domain
MKKTIFLMAIIILAVSTGCMSTTKTRKRTPVTVGTETVSTSVLANDTAMSNQEIQIALKNAGYYEGAIDGILGSRSRDAIRRFQQDNSLKDDSIAGPNTRAKLIKYINTDYKP